RRRHTRSDRDWSSDVCSSDLLLFVAAATPARAELHITRDHGGYVEEYKAKYARVREKGERVIIDGICNSACTLVLGIVPMNKIRSEEHTSELQSRSDLVCRLL